MSITNGYTTLAAVRERLLDQHTYSAATLSFTASSKTISDSARGLKRFITGITLEISGSADNDGLYTVVTGGSPSSIVVSETLIDESAGETVAVTDKSDLIDDASIESTIEASSRWIDKYTSRRFYQASETRYYTAEYFDFVETDDFTAVTALKTDSGDRTYPDTWSNTDYDLNPTNAALEDKPYTNITTPPNGSKSFTTVSRGVQLQATFGYSASAPTPVEEACILSAMRLLKRKDALFGVTGSADFGHVRAILSQDPDIMGLLWPYIRGRLFG